MSRFLRDLENNCTAISRTGFVNSYTDKDFAHYDFDKLVGKNRKHPSASSIRRDARKLVKAEKRIRGIVNKEIAHIDIKNSPRKALKFSEIDAAVDLVLDVYKKYNLMITATEHAIETVIWQFDWAAIFDDAWRIDNTQ